MKVLQFLLIVVFPLLRIHGADSGLPTCPPVVVGQRNESFCTVHAIADNELRILHYHGDALVQEITKVEDSSLGNFGLLTTVNIFNIQNNSKIVLQGIDLGVQGGVIATVVCDETRTYRTQQSINEIPKLGEFYIGKGNQVTDQVNFRKREPMVVVYYEGATKRYASSGSECSAPSAAGQLGNEIKLFSLAQLPSMSICGIEVFEDEAMEIPIPLINVSSTDPEANAENVVDLDDDSCWTASTEHTWTANFEQTKLVKAVRVRLGDEAVPIDRTFISVGGVTVFFFAHLARQQEFLVKESFCPIDGVYYPIVTYPLNSGDPNWQRLVTDAKFPVLSQSFWVWDMIQFLDASHNLEIVLDLSCQSESSELKDPPPPEGGIILVAAAAGSGGIITVAAAYMIIRRRSRRSQVSTSKGVKNTSDKASLGTITSSSASTATGISEKIDSFTPTDPPVFAERVFAPQTGPYGGRVYPRFGEELDSIRYSTLPDV